MLSLNLPNTFITIYCCCSVAQSCLTLCNCMDCSMSGFLVLHPRAELPFHSHRLRTIESQTTGAGRRAPEKAEAQRQETEGKGYGTAEQVKYTYTEKTLGRQSLPHAQINNNGTSLVVQQLRIHFPAHGTQIRSLVRKTPHTIGPTKPRCPHSRAWALETTCGTGKAYTLQLRPDATKNTAIYF